MRSCAAARSTTKTSSRGVGNSAAGALCALPARAIVASIADAATRWADADFPPRVRATAEIRVRTGYSEPVVDIALDRLFLAMTVERIEATIGGELGSVAALDGFVRRAGRPDGFAAAIGRVAIVSSDTTIGVALPPAVFALCAKCDVAVRDRSDAVCGAFRETLCEERPQFADALAVYPPEPRDDATWLAELARADAVVAFGGDEALRAIREAAGAQARFVPFGHRTSIGYVAREALGDEASASSLGDRAATDALLYDGDGCLSMHALFIESGGAIAPSRFAGLLAAAVERSAVEFPATRAAPPPAVAGYRDAAAFRAALGSGVVYASASSPEVVVFDPPRDDPPPLLPRTLAVYPVEGPDEMLAFVRAHALPLEAIAVAGERRDVAEAVLASGAARIARFGTLQAPTLLEEHGGVGRITPFVRWITRER
jgi:acyl-CoA reductase LuxC